MKVALNGVPSLRILDGSWVEGFLPGRTGWPIGSAPGVDSVTGNRDVRDTDALDRTLESARLPCFDGNYGRYLNITIPMEQEISPLGAARTRVPRRRERKVTTHIPGA